MREILFRGKAIKDINSDLTVNTQWVYGYYAKIKPCTGIYGKKEEYIEEEIPKIISGQEAITVNPNTIGQYTGLKDKNGTKIFEGDIVKDANNIINIIKFGFHNVYPQSYPYRCCQAYGFYLESYNESENIVSDFVSGFEIIGNIYDNPELLEDKK